MIATRLSSVWQVAGVAAAALCCYLVSQSVAAERAALGKVNRQISTEQDAIAKLTTEITTRSRLTQVESWNRQLALQAPRPGQYMDSGFQLASLYAHDSKPQLPLDPAVVPPQGPVQMASLPAPAVPAPAVAAPRPAPVPAVDAPVVAPPAMPVRAPVVTVAFHAAAPTAAKHAAQAKPAVAIAAPDAPTLRTAAYVRPKTSRLDDLVASSAVTPASYHPAPTSLLPAALLSDDIAGLAKAEQAKRGSRKPPE